MPVLQNLNSLLLYIAVFRIQHGFTELDVIVQYFLLIEESCTLLYDVLINVVNFEKNFLKSIIYSNG